MEYKQRLLQTRKNSLTKRLQKLNIDIKYVPISFHNIIYGDYLTDKKVRCCKKLKDVVNDVHSFIRFCKHNTEINVYVFKLFCKDEKMFEYNYKVWKDYCQKRDFVFHEEWSNVAKFLSQQDISSLRRAYPLFALSRIKLFQTYKNILLNTLSKNFPEWNENNIFEFNEVLKKVVIIFKGRFVDNQPKEILDKMFYFIFKKFRNVPIRHEKLVKELYTFGLSLREDSSFCKFYIMDNTEQVSLEQVVSTMRITSYLFEKGGHKVWAANRLQLESYMRDKVKYGCDWYNACEQAMKLRLQYPSNYQWDDNWGENWDDDEYWSDS